MWLLIAKYVYVRRARITTQLILQWEEKRAKLWVEKMKRHVKIHDRTDGNNQKIETEVYHYTA